RPSIATSIRSLLLVLAPVVLAPGAVGSRSGHGAPPGRRAFYPRSRVHGPPGRLGPLDAAPRWPLSRPRASRGPRQSAQTRAGRAGAGARGSESGPPLDLRGQ